MKTLMAVVVLAVGLVGIVSWLRKPTSVKAQGSAQVTVVEVDVLGTQSVKTVGSEIVGFSCFPESRALAGGGLPGAARCFVASR
jgi:hypothetical protein